MPAGRFALRPVISTVIFPTARIPRAIIRGATSCARAAGSRWQRICRGAWKRWSASCAAARIGSAELAPVKAGCISVQTLPAGVVPHACGARRVCGIGWVPTSSSLQTWFRTPAVRRACGNEWLSSRLCPREQPFAVCGRDRSEKRHGKGRRNSVDPRLRASLELARDFERAAICASA